MRIAMVGHKHYGSREGGVEVVVTELARRMAALGHEVTCYDRMGKDTLTGVETNGEPRTVDGVRVVPVRTIDAKGMAALSSSFFATKAAIKDKPDVIHYHAEGPCVPLTLAKRAGIRTVATIHGLDWQRAKWGKLASTYIKLGEKTAATKADDLIVLSKSNRDYFKETYGREATLIPNGIEPKECVPADYITIQWNLQTGEYLLFLGRIVPEKCVDLLVEAFKSIDTDKKLVIAGGGSDTSAYEQQVRANAAGDSRIVFTGFVSGQPMEELFSNAYAFVLPSDVEGMPMGLLEAMAYGSACVTSDIPECADVLAETGITFQRGDEKALREALQQLISDPSCASELGNQARAHVIAAYDWDSVVAQTLDLYQAKRGN